MLDKCVFKGVQGSTRFAVEDFFSYERLYAASSQDSYQRATYKEEKFSSIRDPEAALQNQGTNSDESNVT
jgi:hypothetical protein